MTQLLHKLTIDSPTDKIIWVVLLCLTAFSMINFIINISDPADYDESDDSEDKVTFKSIIISLIIFIVFAIGFGTFTSHKNNKSETAINNKEYTLKINGGILDLTSQSPYLKSKQFKIIYQDDSKIQVEYDEDYYDIDKTKEVIHDWFIVSINN